MSSSNAYLERLLELANRRVSADFARVLMDVGVQRDEWRVLEVLADELGRSMGELAIQVDMNHPTLTKLMDRMVAKSWVLRKIDPVDSRRVLVYVTDIGLQLHAQLQQPVEQYQASWESALGERKAKQLRSLLSELLEPR